LKFKELGLTDKVLEGLEAMGFETPTPIQVLAIPRIIAGKDLIACAQTGTGKTAAFVLPVLHNLIERPPNGKIDTLILAPTRELAVQIDQQIQGLSYFTGAGSAAVYGGGDGSSWDVQRSALVTSAEIIVATPGRLIAHIQLGYVDLSHIKHLILDEADRMLDMGFIDDINKIIERLPSERQNLLFSATISDEVRTLARRSISNAMEISIAAKGNSKPKIDQWLITVDKGNKSALLSHLIKSLSWDQALIFIETKHGAAKLVSQLNKRDIAAECIHSGRTQAVREQILADFKSGKIKFLVATAIAARGIDIGDLSRVVNYDVPDQVDDYIHRIGRTGRAGASGEAVSFVAKDNFRNLCAIESRLGRTLERREFEGFPVKKEVPVSILNYVPKNRR
jgi:ATP-dependent RNA helicase RhlE